MNGYSKNKISLFLDPKPSSFPPQRQQCFHFFWFSFHIHFKCAYAGKTYIMIFSSVMGSGYFKRMCTEMTSSMVVL